MMMRLKSQDNSCWNNSSSSTKDLGTSNVQESSQNSSTEADTGGGEWTTQQTVPTSPPKTSTQKCTLYHPPLGRSDIHSHYIKPVPPNYVTEYESEFKKPDPYFYRQHQMPLSPTRSMRWQPHPFPEESMLTTGSRSDESVLSSPSHLGGHKRHRHKPGTAGARTGTGAGAGTGAMHPRGSLSTTDSFSSTEDLHQTATKLVRMKSRTHPTATLPPVDSDTSSCTPVAIPLGVDTASSARAKVSTNAGACGSVTPKSLSQCSFATQCEVEPPLPAFQDLLDIALQLQKIGYHEHHPMLTAAIPILRNELLKSKRIPENTAPVGMDESVWVLYDHMRDALDSSTGSTGHRISNIGKDTISSDGMTCPVCTQPDTLTHALCRSFVTCVDELTTADVQSTIPTVASSRNGA